MSVTRKPRRHRHQPLLRTRPSGGSGTERAHPPQRIALYHADTLVASHPRHFERNARLVVPEHYEAVFVHKPRARVIAYRDWLVQLSKTSADYISQLCRKRYAEMEREMLALYQLAHEVGTAEFLAALELAYDQQTFGAEYVQALLAQPAAHPEVQQGRARRLEALLQLPEPACERELAQYEQYVANRALAVVGRGQ